MMWFLRKLATCPESSEVGSSCVHLDHLAISLPQPALSLNRVLRFPTTKLIRLHW